MQPDAPHPSPLLRAACTRRLPFALGKLGRASRCLPFNPPLSLFLVILYVEILPHLCVSERSSEHNVSWEKGQIRMLTFCKNQTSKLMHARAIARDYVKPRESLARKKRSIRLGIQDNKMCPFPRSAVAMRNETSVCVCGENIKCSLFIKRL